MNVPVEVMIGIVVGIPSVLEKYVLQHFVRNFADHTLEAP